MSITGTVNYVSSFDLTDPSFGADPADPTTGVNDCLTGLQIGAGSTAYSAQLGSGVVPNGVKCRVAAFTTFDLTGKYDVNKQLSVQASILNLFNTGAPQDWGTYGGGTAPYNPSLHSQGAIGRYFNLGLRYTF